MDVVSMSVGRNEVTEGDESSYYRNGSQEHQREGHGQRAFVRCVCGMKFFVLLTPEDAAVEAEHIESCHGCNDCHDPSHRGAELEAGS